jgi:CRP-like cAMP-binding protein
MSAIDKRELLSTHYLFRDMDEGVIERLVHLGVTRHLEDNENLFLKGDPGDALYGVLAGRIRISASAPSGKEVILSIMEAGDIFGEIALLDGMARTADAWGIGQAQLFKINRREFLDFLDRQPSLYVHLLQMVCERVRSTNEFVEDYAFLGLPARLAKRLLSLSKFFAETEPDDDSKGLHISQSELGQLMGRTRETINRQLQVWRKKGWIELPHGHIKIVDHEALRELIENDYEG